MGMNWIMTNQGELLKLLSALGVKHKTNTLPYTFANKESIFVLMNGDWKKMAAVTEIFPT